MKIQIKRGTNKGSTCGPGTVGNPREQVGNVKKLIEKKSNLHGEKYSK